MIIEPSFSITWKGLHKIAKTPLGSKSKANKETWKQIVEIPRQMMFNTAFYYINCPWFYYWAIFLLGHFLRLVSQSSSETKKKLRNCQLYKNQNFEKKMRRTKAGNPLVEIKTIIKIFIC